jgi:hypothetical protein
MPLRALERPPWSFGHCASSSFSCRWCAGSIARQIANTLAPPVTNRSNPHSATESAADNLSHPLTQCQDYRPAVRRPYSVVTFCLHRLQELQRQQCIVGTYCATLCLSSPFLDYLLGAGTLRNTNLLNEEGMKRPVEYPSNSCISR